MAAIDVPSNPAYDDSVRAGHKPIPEGTISPVDKSIATGTAAVGAIAVLSGVAWLIKRRRKIGRDP